MPPVSSIVLYAAFAMAIRELCSAHDVSVTSWWRTRARNDHVGGLPNSRHLDGIGADIELDPGQDRADVIATARALGLQVVDEGDHIHVELDPN